MIDKIYITGVLLLKKTITITYNDYAVSEQVANLLKEKLCQADFDARFTYDGSEELLVAIGGDGAFLKAMHDFDFPKIPIVGVNTGHLGFFQDIQPDELDVFIHAYQNENYSIQEIYPLSAVIFYKDKVRSVKAINDIVLRSSLGKTVHLDLRINGTFIECFRGDGLIISSTTGSTAYNYSAGGAIVDPSIKTLQLTPLAPLNTNAYRSFTSSIISSWDSDIKVGTEESDRNHISLLLDGVQKHYNDFKQLQVTTCKESIHLVRMKNYEFWNKVTDKFL